MPRVRKYGVNYDAGELLVAMRPTVRVLLRHVERSRGVQLPRCGSFTIRAHEAIRLLEAEFNKHRLGPWIGTARLVNVLENYSCLSQAVRLMETMHSSSWKGVV